MQIASRSDHPISYSPEFCISYLFNPLLQISRGNIAKSTNRFFRRKAFTIRENYMASQLYGGLPLLYPSIMSDIVQTNKLIDYMALNVCTSGAVRVVILEVLDCISDDPSHSNTEVKILGAVVSHVFDMPEKLRRFHQYLTFHILLL